MSFETTLQGPEVVDECALACPQYPTYVEKSRNYLDVFGQEVFKEDITYCRDERMRYFTGAF